MKLRVIVYSCIFGLLLSGCGQKGPLYLPNQNDKEASSQVDSSH